ncbi:hypothetical protein QTN47_07425 [Danxiaibacter flavus]|uniref:N-acetyltransferase domain-containing protein n=1 Tax=Danxiaibacter flavus TaxID=3049108 RepID=A0ABV3ZCK5_9BACT|nr:hypothetical protein QNM32_07425 [Chitinophagaceae bacterium DXS]
MVQDKDSRMTVDIRIFRADENPDDTMRYIQGHRKILEAYGVTQVTSASLDWMNEPYTFIVMVESAELGKVMGGARIQIASGQLPLPIETAIDDLDTSIFDYVKAKIPGRTAEFCGLWNSREVAGFGIGSIFLGRVGVAIIEQLRLGSLFAFASQATYKNCMRVGFRIIKKLGINGTFYYPKEDLLATALIIEDPADLEGANEEDRERILDMRNRPVQTAIEKGPKGEIIVNYDLRVNSASVLNLPLESHFATT